MKKAIVTGANGFVGAAVVGELLSHGVEVLAVVRSQGSSYQNISHLKGVRIIFCALSEITTLETLISDRDIDVFYHLAWDGVSGRARADSKLQLNNVQYAVDCVDVAQKLGCHRFVGAGTLAELDCQSYTPTPGATPNAVSHYATAKITAHYMTKTQCNHRGIQHIWAYISNTYGMGDRSLNFINFAVKSCLTNPNPGFSPATQNYDFVHVSDTVQGLFLLGDRGQNNHPYYIGSGAPGRLKEFILQIRDAVHPDLPIQFGAVPFHGVFHNLDVFDCTTLMEDTGYTPSMSFPQGLDATIPWLTEEIKGGRL